MIETRPLKNVVMFIICISAWNFHGSFSGCSSCRYTKFGKNSYSSHRCIQTPFKHLRWSGNYFSTSSKITLHLRYLTGFWIRHWFPNFFTHTDIKFHGSWVKVFKNGPSEICGRQPLKNFKWYGLLRLSSINFTWIILGYLHPVDHKDLLKNSGCKNFNK